jgi:hypothetical protein
MGLTNDDVDLARNKLISASTDANTEALTTTCIDLQVVHESETDNRRDSIVEHVIGYNYDDNSTVGGLYIRVGIGSKLNKKNMSHCWSPKRIIFQDALFEFS